MLPLWDDNLVISFHKYWNHNTPESIATHLALREQTDAPIWLGESGENSNVWFADAIRLVEDRDIGWAFWPLKKIGFNNPLEVRPNAGYTQLVEYWNDRGPKPTADAAYAALMQLASHDVRFENTVHHEDVIDAMLRQPHDAATRPFTPHAIGAGGGRIAAVDYDLGRMGSAYFDTDAANYHVATGGERTLWNDGRTYRNDGVDIGTEAGNGEHYVTHIEAKEWLQFTFHATSAGRYTLELLVAATSGGGKVAIAINGAAPRALAVPATGGETQWVAIDLPDVMLERGSNVLVLLVERGGFNLSALQFDPASAPRAPTAKSAP